MRRTTVRLDDKLLSDVKRHAAQTGRTVTAVIEDALRRTLAVERDGSIARPKRLPVFKGTGLRSGVSLDSNAALRDAMDDF
jgi:hypothetical protein